MTHKLNARPATASSERYRRVALRMLVRGQHLAQGNKSHENLLEI